jgi:hypothetical protein
MSDETSPPARPAGQEDSRQTETAFNPGRYPIVDRNGRPFTPGCRVKFVLPSYYVNTFSDTGTLASPFDVYGGVTIRADHEHSVYDNRGYVVDRRHEVYATSRYQYEGAYRGHRVTAAGLGDPHEHGVTLTYVEVIDE